jgi:dCMP deaminase
MTYNTSEKTNRLSWAEYFRKIAHTVKLKSKDKSTQIGAVIVGSNNEIRSTGYNSFPRGIEDFHDERQERPEKYYWMEHAERNAIINAARIGVSTDRCTLFLTCDIPCVDCTRAIINSGIKIIFCERGEGAKGQIWDGHAERSIQMMKEAKLTLWYYGESKPFINIGEIDDWGGKYE